MALEIRKVRADKPPRILIYGPAKMGKTTLASEFPSAVFLQTEDGVSGDLELDSLGKEPPVKSFVEVLDLLGDVAGEDHNFQTLVVDSLSELEKLVFAETCRRNQWASIEQPGYGKGYAAADEVWKEFVDAFNYLREERGMTIVLIGHASIERFDDPETQSYSRYDIDLHKRAKAILEREVDAILLVKKDVTIKTEDQGFNKKRVTAAGGDARWIHAQGRPAFTAGNRYNIPDRVPFKLGDGYGQIAGFLPTHNAPSAQKKAA